MDDHDFVTGEPMVTGGYWGYLLRMGQPIKAPVLVERRAVP